MIILEMVINMNEERLGTIEQIEEFLSGSAAIEFTVAGDDGERYGHISRAIKRFDYPRRNKRERGILHRYLQHTTDHRAASFQPITSDSPLLKTYQLLSGILRQRLYLTARVRPGKATQFRCLGRPTRCCARIQARSSLWFCIGVRHILRLR